MISNHNFYLTCWSDRDLNVSCHFRRLVCSPLAHKKSGN